MHYNGCPLDVGWVSVGGGPLTVGRGSVGDLSGVLVVRQGSVGGLFWGSLLGSPLGVSIGGLHQGLRQVSIRGPLGFH